MVEQEVDVARDSTIRVEGELIDLAEEILEAQEGRWASRSALLRIALKRGLEQILWGEPSGRPGDLCARCGRERAVHDEMGSRFAGACAAFQPEDRLHGFGQDEASTLLQIARAYFDSEPSLTIDKLVSMLKSYGYLSSFVGLPLVPEAPVQDPWQQVPPVRFAEGPTEADLFIRLQLASCVPLYLADGLDGIASKSWDPTVKLGSAPERPEKPGRYRLRSRPYPCRRFRFIGLWIEPLQDCIPVSTTVKIERVTTLVGEPLVNGGARHGLPIELFYDWPVGKPDPSSRNPGFSAFPIVIPPNAAEVEISVSGTGTWSGRVFALVEPL